MSEKASTEIFWSARALRTGRLRSGGEKIDQFAADVVLMDDDPAKISLAMKISRKCMHIVYQNIVFALAVKAIFLLLGAFGIANMWWAVFADVGVMILAVLNAMRMLIVEKN